MSTSITEQEILKYKELKPDIGYYDLVKIFGLPLKELLKLLNINDYNIRNKTIRFYDDNGNEIYYEHSYGVWEKYKFDANGYIIYFENSYGNWKKYKYDVNGKLIKRSIFSKTNTVLQ